VREDKVKALGKGGCVKQLALGFNGEEEGMREDEDRDKIHISLVDGLFTTKTSIHVCLPDIDSLIPGHHLSHRRHVANHSPPEQTNVIRTKIKMINICSGRLERLVT